MNNWPEEKYDPQSRFDNLDKFEPEFWKKKKQTYPPSHCLSNVGQNSLALSWWRCGDLHSGLERFNKSFYILIV